MSLFEQLLDEYLSVDEQDTAMYVASLTYLAVIIEPRTITPPAVHDSCVDLLLKRVFAFVAQDSGPGIQASPLTRLDTPLTRLETPLTRLETPLLRLDTPLTRLDTPLSSQLRLSYYFTSIIRVILYTMSSMTCVYVMFIY